MNVSTLKNVGHAAMRYLLGTFCAGKVGFSIDANANDVQTTTAAVYCVDGGWYTLGIDAAIDISAEIADLPSNLLTGYTQVFLFEVDGAGAYTVSAGDQVLTADITAGTKSANVPDPSSSTVCPFGMLKVVNATGSDFVLGTTALDTANITDTFTDICRVPISA